MTPSQNEVYEHLKKYRDFPANELNKCPHLAHLKNPAERYKYFCEAGNRKKALIPELEQLLEA